MSLPIKQIQTRREQTSCCPGGVWERDGLGVGDANANYYVLYIYV